MRRGWVRRHIYKYVYTCISFIHRYEGWIVDGEFLKSSHTYNRDVCCKGKARRRSRKKTKPSEIPLFIILKREDENASNVRSRKDII